MLLHFDALAIDSWSSLLLPIRTAVPFGRATYSGFNRPDSHHGKCQDIKSCNLAQVEYAVKMDIKIEWNSDDND